jgi:hypothetical protein
MRITTPHATPVAAAAQPPSSPAAAGGQPPPKLAGATLVVWHGGQHLLTDGSLLIGRSHECDVRLDDPLVSRLHARVRVEADRVGLEDLHSTNGVYLRGERVTRFALLADGDRVMIGTHELSFFGYSEELSPDSGVGAHEPRLELPPRAEASPATARAAAIEMVGNLGRRFAREGRAEEGAKLLIPHLKRILRGASSGLEAPQALCEQAAAYAMDVAVWTADAAWLDYIVELHIATKTLMPCSAILALQRAERWLGAIDRLLLQYYIEICAARADPQSEDEQLRLRLLERLLLAKF